MSSKLICITVFILTLFSSSVVFAGEPAGGGAGTHGGESIVSEFTGSARLLADEILRHENPSECPSSVDFLKVINSTKVSTRKVVIADGESRNAINNSRKNFIRISSTRVSEIKDSLNYLTLVLHEYNGILGTEKTNDFHSSHACMKALNSRGVDFDRLRYRSKEANACALRYEDSLSDGIIPIAQEMRRLGYVTDSKRATLIIKARYNLSGACDEMDRFYIRVERMNGDNITYLEDFFKDEQISSTCRVWPGRPVSEYSLKTVSEKVAAAIAAQLPDCRK